MRSTKPYYKVNYQIKSPKLRLIGSDGKQIGVIETSKALSMANEEGLDLVEIAPNTNPPVAKIVSLGKFKYEIEKKLRQQKKKTKAPDIKEIRFSPFIGSADYQTRLERIKEFLDDGHKVRIVVKFKGRQMNSKKFGYEIIDRIVEEFKNRIVIDMEPKFIGRHLASVISPLGSAKSKQK